MDPEHHIKNYLYSHHTKSTAYGYYRQIMLYLGEQPGAANACYKDILRYVEKLRKRYHKANTVKSMLNAIKKYYAYLIITGKRNDHPCRNLNIKDARHKDIQLQDLLNESELESLLDYQSKRYGNVLHIRDRALLSLLVYQGLTKGEITRLTIADIDTTAGTIYISSCATSNSRTLEMKSSQVLLFYKYITQVRPELLKLQQESIATDILFLSIRGTPEKGDGLTYIFREIKKQKGKKITSQLIRQSVIALQLKKGNDIRYVQVFAGHKNASSTERYKATDIEELKAGIGKYHPLQ